jgi:hypothetical protein
MTRATVDGLRRLVRPEDVAELRGKRIVDVLPFRPAAEEAAVEPAAEETAEQ